MNEQQSLTKNLAAMGVEPVTFRAMQDLHPGAKPNSLLMVLRYCRAARLDPLRSPVAILPIDGKEIPVLTINGLRAHAARTRAYAGGHAVFSDTVEDFDGIGLPTWCRYVVERIMQDDSRAEFSGQVFAREVVGRTKQGKLNRIWQTRPFHMMQIAAERLALRRAFPESVPADDAAPARRQIDPATGEIHGPAPRHLSDADIAAGIEHVDATQTSEPDADWLDAYDSAG